MTDHTLDASATSEIERPQRALLTVDFVTAFSVEECRQWLEYASDQIDTQRVDLWDDDSFTIRCCRDSDPGDPYDDSAARVFEVRFWGTLEPRERGTWVWGTSIENPDVTRRRSGVPPTIVVVILLALTFEAYFRGAQTAMLVWLAGLAGLGVWWIITWWERHRRALRVILWLWETLYVKPPRQETDEDADQIAEDEAETQA
jgi:hypothetical protein